MNRYILGGAHLIDVEGPGSFASLFEPVLDTYMDASVGLVGCRSTGLEREGCEYDLLVVRPERNPPATLKVGDVFVDLAFSTESDLTAPRSPEHALSLAFVKPVRDRDLLLSSSSSAARESLNRNYQKCAEERLASAVKGMGRAEEALTKGAKGDADFWLLSAGYDFAYAWLSASEVIPSPSHLLSQLRQLSRGQPGMFETFSNATGLGAASRKSCDARLDALGLIYDLKGTPGSDEGSAAPESVRASYDLLRRKSAAALQASQPAESFCFLGLEVARSLPQILKSRYGRKETSALVSSLSGGEGSLLAQSVVGALGIVRPLESVEKALGALRSRVSALTRKT